MKLTYDQYKKLDQAQTLIVAVLNEIAFAPGERTDRGNLSAIRADLIQEMRAATVGCSLIVGDAPDHRP